MTDAPAAPPPLDTDEEWRSTAVARERPGLLAIALMSATLVPCWALFDAFLEPSRLREFVALRLVDSAAAFALAVVLHRARSLAVLRTAGAAVLVLTGVIVGVIVARVGDLHHTDYVVGFSLVFWGSAVAVVWPLTWHAACDVLMLGVWLAAEAWLPPRRLPREFLGPLFYLLTATVISLVSLHVARLRARRVFDSAVALEHRNRELGKALEQLRHAQARLVESEKMSALGRLLAGLSHEINNPMNVIANNLGPLGEYVESLGRIAEAGRAAPAVARLWTELEADLVRDDARGALADLAQAVERIRNIHGELRAFVRGDAPRLVEGDLRDGLRATVGMLRRTLPAGVEIVEDYGEAVRFAFHPGQLNQVFLNLIQNAVEAVGSRGRVTVSARRAGDAMEVAVSDDGPGVPPSVREHLFEPFFTTKGPASGTGLGLATCYEIVTRHGGALFLDETHAPGARFVVRLPTARERDEAA